MTEINTRAEAEEATKRGARLKALKTSAEAARDTAVLRAQKTKSKRITRLAKELDEITVGLEVWSKENRKEFTGQSLVFDFGSLNFRVGNPEVALLKGWKLKTVLARMVRQGKVLAQWRPWIRVKFELHKTNILSACAKNPEATQKKLATVGLVVDRGESFEVEFGVKQKL